MVGFWTMITPAFALALEFLLTFITWAWLLFWTIFWDCSSIIFTFSYGTLGFVIYSCYATLSFVGLADISLIVFTGEKGSLDKSSMELTDL